MIKVKEVCTGKPIEVDILTNAIIKKGFSPYIGENGNWYQYDNEKKEFIDTGIKAEGKDGVDGKNGLNGRDGINGKDGTNGIDGKNGVDGKDGYTPVKGIDYFDGKDGKDGKDGITPDLKGYATEKYVDSKIGNINTVLKEIIGGDN